MKERSFDEMIAYFNRRVSEMDIAQGYKMELLGMVTALGYKHEKTVPQWTPMSEHEPKFGNYLTTFREKATGNVDVAIDLYWSGGWDDDGNGKFETLAWMPLPEPWRGEGHGNRNTRQGSGLLLILHTALAGGGQRKMLGFILGLFLGVVIGMVIMMVLIAAGMKD